MGALKNFGVIKFDILSLTTLDVIQECIDAIGHDPFEDMHEYEDPKVWDTINNGACSGIFQVEGGASRQVVRDLQVKSFEDLVAVMALGRGGANQFVIPYREGRDNPRTTHNLPDQRLYRIMPKGVILYQEQVMDVVHTIAGADYHLVDEFKEAIKYKKGDIWDNLKPYFFNGGTYIDPHSGKSRGSAKGALNNGCRLDVAQKIWDMIFAYRGYGFNRAHSCAYAMLAYQTAWLKTYYPAIFYKTLLGVKDVVERPHVIEEARRHFGIRFLPPDINKSEAGFSVAGERRIRYGIGAVKNVGVVACQELLAQRPFDSLDDLRERVTKRKCNARVLANLQRVGALRSLGVDPDTNLADTEMELLGAYVSAHPLDKYRKVIDRRMKPDLRWLQMGVEKNIWVGGILTLVRPYTTKTQKEMAFARVEYPGLGEWDIVIFPEMYTTYRASLKKGRPVCVYGRYQPDRGSLILDTLELPKAEDGEFLNVRT